MKVDNQILSNFGISVPGSRAEVGDGTLHIPPAVLFTQEPITPTLRLVGSGATVENSINVGVAVNRNNQAASGNIIATFLKGLYEIDALLSARFNWTGVGTTTHTYVELRDPTGTFSNPIIPFFAFIGVQTQVRKFRVLFSQDGWTIRLSYGATGVAENLDAITNCQLTRIL